MKAAGAPQKLRFTIQSCSGEDSDYPVRELLFHSPQTRGWQSPRFCKYPQEILLRLEATSKIQQIQILSHEYKIATKVEVFVGAPTAAEPDPSKTPLKRLGYLSFDSNERSNHQARELKSVHVNVSAYYIRLIIHRCHVNKLNIYNQVGIIALNLIGEVQAPQPSGPPGFLELHAPAAREIPYYNAAAAEVADLNLDIHVDTVTASKIRDLVRLKDQAVASEEYDEAKRLKATIDRLKVVGQKIAQLEGRKRAAVEKEDYDTAKLIKVDIDKLRAAGDAVTANGAADSHRGKNPDDIFNRVLATRKASSSGTGGGGHPPPPGLAEEASSGRMGRSGSVAYDGPASPTGMDAHAHDMESSHLAPEDSYPPTGNSVFGGSSKHAAYDDRPLKGKGVYNEDGAAGMNGGLGSAPPMQQAIASGDIIPAPSGWPGDLPHPEPLTAAVAKDAEGLEEVAGEFIARAFYSKNWQLRDAAIQHLVREAKDGQLNDKRDAFRVLMRTAQRGMRDKVANVFLSSLSMFQSIIDVFAHTISSRDSETACESSLPILIEKLGDNNARLREASKEVIMFIAGLRDANLRAHTHHFSKVIKNQSAWRPVLGILQIMQDLVPLIGISKNGDGFDLSELMDFVGKAYSSANADVRSQAVRITKEVYDLVGPAIRKHLPKDINPKIKEQVDAVIGGESAPPPPPAAPPPAARQPPRSTASNGAGGTGRGAPPASKGGAPTKTGRGGPAAVQPPPPPPPVAPDDPAPFLEELRQRERNLGKDHVDVAESCSNLAILYNQKGDTSRALPLYERALRIYEKSYGPDHPEVAHTLTDLAVLHLEQGRDLVGRPLLERALAIQIKALGPDHPDVLAIKDVLNSPDA